MNWKEMMRVDFTFPEVLRIMREDVGPFYIRIYFQDDLISEASPFFSSFSAEQCENCGENQTEEIVFALDNLRLKLNRKISLNEIEWKVFSDNSDDKPLDTNLVERVILKSPILTEKPFDIDPSPPLEPKIVYASIDEMILKRELGALLDQERYGYHVERPFPFFLRPNLNKIAINKDNFAYISYNKVIMFDLNDELNSLVTLDHGELKIHSVFLSGDNHVAVSTTCGAVIWDVLKLELSNRSAETSTPLYCSSSSFPPWFKPVHMEFSHNGTYLAFFSYRSEIVIMNVSKGAPELALLIDVSHQLASIYFDLSEGDFLAVCSYEHIEIWDIKGKNRVRELKMSFHMYICISWSSTERSIFLTQNGQVKVVDIQKQEIVKSWDVAGGIAYYPLMVVSPNMQLLAVASSMRIFVHNVITGEVVDEVENPYHIVDMKFSNSGKQLILLSGSGKIYACDAKVEKRFKFPSQRWVEYKLQ